MCSESGAFKAGKARAKNGQTEDFSVGHKCEGKEAQTFSSNYQRGYQAGLQTYCSNDRAYKEGMALGVQGSKDAPQARYAICANRLELARSFDDGITAGMEQFCAPDSMSQEGLRQGASGQRPTFPRERAAVCSADQVQSMRAAFRQSHRDALAGYCQVADAEESGFQDGSSGQRRNLATLLSACNASERRDAQRRYRAGLVSGKEERKGQAKLVAIQRAEERANERARQADARAEAEARAAAQQQQTQQQLDARHHARRRPDQSEQLISSIRRAMGDAEDERGRCDRTVASALRDVLRELEARRPATDRAARLMRDLERDLDVCPRRLERRIRALSDDLQSYARNDGPEVQPPVVVKPVVTVPTASWPEECVALWAMTRLMAMSDNRDIALVQRFSTIPCADEANTGEIRWPNGKVARYTTGEWHYPNGRTARYASGELHYPNGKAARYASGEWHYPNGKVARYSNDEWHYPNGRLAGNAQVMELFACEADSDSCDTYRHHANSNLALWRNLVLVQKAWAAR